MSTTDRKILIAPSILAADFVNLERELKTLESADLVHVDVMDGHFVPNLTIGPALVKAIGQVAPKPLDVHLMIEEPERSIQQYVDAGADRVTVHAETCPHLHRTLTQIRETGAQVGVALNPSTPLGSIVNVLHLTDLVLIMTVNPGFGGQSFITETLPKLRALRTLANQRTSN